MGTNYYWKTGSDKRCESCGHQLDAPTETHIGKSSAGWVFSLHVDRVSPDDTPFPLMVKAYGKPISDLPDWQRVWEAGGGTIVDEYGRELTQADMLTVIAGRGSERPWDQQVWLSYRDEADFHFRNGSERGPNNLLRHKLDTRCVGHGAGTWDMIVGEFS